MEGAHRAGRSLKDVIVGSKATAKLQRGRAQQGVAAAGRRAQAVQIARGTTNEKSAEDKAIDKEVERAMKAGTGLVQAALEHLDTAERSWDRFVEQGGHVIDGYPSEGRCRSGFCARDRRSAPACGLRARAPPHMCRETGRRAG